MRIRSFTVSSPALLGLILLSLSGLSEAAASRPASRFSVKVGGDYVFPAAASMRGIYGRGWGWGGEIGVGLGRFLEVWVSGQGRNASGRLPFTLEGTKISLLSFGLGLRARFAVGPLVFYAGAGPGLMIYKETNPIGTASGRGFGPVGMIGLGWRMAAGLSLDAEAGYSRFVVKPGTIETDLGGAALALRLGYGF